MDDEQKENRVRQAEIVALAIVALALTSQGCDQAFVGQRPDSAAAQVVPPTPRRYEVIHGKAHGVMAPVDVVIKLDSVTGETWMACTMEGGGWGWCKMPDGDWGPRIR